MTKKDWLNRYRYAVRSIDRIADEIATWRSKAEKITPTLSDMPSGVGGDRIQNCVEKIIEIEKEYEQELNNVIKIKREIEKAINNLNDPQERDILKYRFINFKSYEQIAWAMHIQRSRFFQIMKNALDNLKIE